MACVRLSLLEIVVVEEVDIDIGVTIISCNGPAVVDFVMYSTRW